VSATGTGEARPAEWPTLLAALLSGDSMYEAAAKAGVSRRTAGRWRKRFRADLDNAVEQLAAAALRELSVGLLAAAARLRQVVEKGTEANAVNAARALLAGYGQMAETILLQDRLAAIEEALGIAPRREHDVAVPAFRQLLPVN